MPKILYFITLCTLFRRNGKILIFSDIYSMMYIQRKEWPLFGFWGPDWTLWQDLFI